MMNYRESFRIEIDHQYFVAKGAADLAIVPDARTLRFLQGRHLLLKSTDKGLKILIPLDANGIAKCLADQGSVLMFDIFPKSSAFSLITDMSELATGEVFHYTNAGLSPGTATLLQSKTQDRGALGGFPIVAKVEIHLTEALLAGAAPTHYAVVLKAKSAKWKYYFVSDKEATDLIVEDRNEGLVFNRMDLGEGSPDKIGTSLRLNFPADNIYLFESDAAIAYSNQAVKNLQLLRDGHVVIQHLPNPEIADGAVKIIRV